MMQSCFQKYVDNAISKTVNFNHDATREEIGEAYKLAYDLGCKGVTVYRDGCRENQTLNLGAAEKKDETNDLKVSTTTDGCVRVFLDAIYNLEATQPRMAPSGGAMIPIFDTLMDEMSTRAATDPTSFPTICVQLYLRIRCGHIQHTNPVYERTRRWYC